MALPGCGTETYKSRLNQTAEYFEYRDELNRNLSETRWEKKGIKYRVPKQFEPVPIPEPETGFTEPGSNPEEPGNPNGPADGSPDGSSSGFLVDSLPGLVGAWQAKVGVEGQQDDQPAYLYVMSNYDFWLLPDAEEAAPQFHQTAVFDLTNALGIPSPPMPHEQNTAQEKPWTQETLPDGKAYVDKKKFWLTAPPLTTELHGLQYDVVIYLHEVDDIQVVVAFVIPQNWTRRENLDDRIQMSLETLKVSGDKPTPEEGGARGPERDSGF